MHETLLRSIAYVLAALVALLTVRMAPRLPGLERLKPDVAAGRLSGIDGIRGFLALAVFVYHALRMRAFYLNGDYDAIPPGMLESAGEFAVSVFFGITGYLFWTRAIEGKIKARTLYVRRFWRVYPLYAGVVLFSVALGLLHRPWIETPAHLLKVAAKVIIPGPGINESINGSTLIIGQVWTLFYEVCFYLILPLLAPLGRRPWTTWLLAAIALGVAHIFPKDRVHFLLAVTPNVLPLFAVGMIVAVIARRERARAVLGGSVGSCLMVGAILVRFTLMHRGYGLGPAVAMFATLLPLVCGADLFGLLSLRPCRELGEISYSLYMVHLLVLMGSFVALNRVVPIGSMPETAFWLLMMPVTAVLVAVCLVTFRLLELPYMGRRPLPGADAAP